MAVNLAPCGNDAPFVDSSGDPLSGGLLYTYQAGSTTPENTYTTSAGSVANANPVVLNANGYPASAGSVVQIWLTAGQSYKFVLKTSAGTTVWTRDNINGINDTSVSIDQWVAGPTPTYIGATSFSLVGDQTSTFMVGRRLKTTNSGGTIYSTITVSAYTTLTTVTVVNDSGTLDSGLSAVSYGLLTNTNNSVPSFMAKGDLLTQSAAGTLARVAVGSNGTVPMARSAETTGLAYVAALNKAIYGLTYSNNGSDATNDLDIATGGAMDATGAYWMTLASALTKQSDVAWAVGSAAGGLDTGAVGNSEYYIWLIARSDTGVVDVLFSLSSTSPTMPASYDYKRLIGWFKRSGGAILSFDTYEIEGGGLEFKYDAPILDVDSTSLTTSRLASSVSVPKNFSTIAIMRFYFTDAAGAFVNVNCPDETDAAPSATASPGVMFITGAGTQHSDQYEIRTSSTGTIAARATAAMDTYRVMTLGFKWARR